MTLKVAINGRFLTHYASGVVRVAAEITKALDRLIREGAVEGEFRLLCPKGTSADELGLEAIKVQHVGCGMRGHAWEQVALPWAARNETLLCLGNTAPILSLVGKRHVGVMVHDLSYRQYPSAYTKRYRLGHSLLAPALLNYANPIFTVSQSEKRLIQALVPSREAMIIVAQNGGWSDSELKTPAAPNQARGDGYALYVGSFSERKNIHGIQAAAIELARSFGVRTKLAGSPGSIFQYSAPEIPPDVAHLIDFVGHVEDVAELEKLYRGASVFLFPSFYEASPLPPTEAMYFGCPVVASDIPSIRERCGDAVAYCDPHDVSSIVSVAYKVLSDRQFSRELIEKGYARQLAFSWRQQAMMIWSALRDSMHDRGRSEITNVLDVRLEPNSLDDAKRSAFIA